MRDERLQFLLQHRRRPWLIAFSLFPPPPRRGPISLAPVGPPIPMIQGVGDFGFVLLGDLLALRWLGLDPFAELDPAVPDERFRIISGQFERACGGSGFLDSRIS